MSQWLALRLMDASNKLIGGRNHRQCTDGGMWGMSKRVRRIVSLAVSAVLAIGALNVIAPTAAAATYPVKSFTVKYGNTYAAGKVTFYNRSVLVDFTIKSVAGDDCRFARAATYDKIEMHESFRTVEVCGTTEHFSETLNSYNKGGAAYVLVELVAGCCGTDRGKPVGQVKVYKN